jgi:hypothetical protein
MVGSWWEVNAFSTKRRIKLVLPTPRYPTTASLRCSTPRGEGGRRGDGARGEVDDGGIILVPVNIRRGGNESVVCVVWEGKLGALAIDWIDGEKEDVWRDMSNLCETNSTKQSVDMHMNQAALMADPNRRRRTEQRIRRCGIMGQHRKCRPVLMFWFVSWGTSLPSYPLNLRVPLHIFLVRLLFNSFSLCPS